MKINKKVTIFGKQITVVALALMAMVGLASAGLVTYLSGMFVVTATVESPIDLALYDEIGGNNLLPSSGTMYGGNSLLFSKIAYNKADVDIPFAIVVVFKNTDGVGITVTSAGPCTAHDEYSSKCVDSSGYPAPVSDSCWCQDLTTEAGYLHGQCSDGSLSPPVEYDDTMTVWVGGTQYYVVTFGDQIDDVTKGEDAIITRLGWGTPAACYSDPGDEKTIINSEEYDTGTIKITLAPNIAPQGYEFKARVVAPGQTVGDIISEMF